MTTSAPVTVTLDDRARLVATALAATDYPDRAQARKRHHAHALARSTRKFMQDRGLNRHPAVRGMQQLLDQNAPLEAFFTLAMQMRWPGLAMETLPRWAPREWNRHLWNLYNDADLKRFSDENKPSWDAAQTQAQAVFRDVRFKDFLEPFLGQIQEELVFMPNLMYPADADVGIRVNRQIIAIVPPPQAWGDSPPWPYDEETMLTHSYRAALTQYGRLLLLAFLRRHAEQVAPVAQKPLPVSDQFRILYPTWEQQFIALFIAAAVAMYLEDHVDKAEAQAYMVIEKKARGMTILPGTISVLRRYLQERGKRYETLIDFLPVFPAQLRVAKRIIAL